MKIVISESYILNIDEAMFTNSDNLEYHYNKQVLKPGEEFNELDPKFAHIEMAEYERLAKELSDAPAGSYEKNSNSNNLKNKVFGWKIVNKNTGNKGRYIKIKLPTTPAKHNPNMLPEVVIYSPTDDIVTYYLVRNFGKRYNEWSQNFVGELPENKADEISNTDELLTDVTEQLVLDEASSVNFDYDYGTGSANVNARDVFDTHRSDSSYSTGLLPGSKQVDYYRDEKNKKGEIVYMTAQEYFDACADGFSKAHGKTVTADDLKRSRQEVPGHEHIDDLKKIVVEKGKKLPIPYLDYTRTFGQEGLHRMMAMAELFDWDKTKFPVLVIKHADEQRHIEELKWLDQRKIESDIIRPAVEFHFNDVDELIEELKWQLERDKNSYGWEYIKHPDKLEFEYDNGTITVIDPESDFKFSTDEYEVTFREPSEQKEEPESADISDEELDALLAAEVEDDDVFI